MVEKIRVSSYEEKEKEEKKKKSKEEQRRGLLGMRRRIIFYKLVEGEKENVLLRLVLKFKGLRYEDLEEVYDDGCLVLWEKMMDENFELREISMVGYLMRICCNIGMHYLRKVNEDVMSLDRLMEKGFGDVDNERNGLEEMFEVLSENESDEEKYKKLEKVWKRLKDVERMILECYYVEGCRMEEIARRLGYKNGNSVKSKKNRVLRKMMSMMN